MSENDVKNMKGLYFTRDMGDGTNCSLVYLKRPDDHVPALAMRFRLGAGKKMLTCFLEDKDGVCFVDDLTNAMIEFSEDRTAMEEDASEEAGQQLILRQEEKSKVASGAKPKGPTAEEQVLIDSAKAAEDAKAQDEADAAEEFVPEEETEETPTNS